MKLTVDTFAVRSLKYVQWSSAAGIFISALATCGVLLLLVLAALLAFHLRSPVITHSNPVYVFIVLLVCSSRS